MDVRVENHGGLPCQFGFVSPAMSSPRTEAAHPAPAALLKGRLYGDVVFPFQVIFALSRPGAEFTGGELLLVEQRPRAQSIGHAIRMERGEAVVITTRYRPAKGSRGYYRTNFRHGVSKVLSGGATHWGSSFTTPHKCILREGN